MFAYSFAPSTFKFYLMGNILFGLGTIKIAMFTQLFNQLKEIELDKKMKRTNKRPLPKGLISKNKALKLGYYLFRGSIFSYLLLGCLGGYSLNAIGFSSLIAILYNIFYTNLKLCSNLSTHIGAVVGALVPILGTFAASGNLFDILSINFGLFIFAWQYPHFYSINFKHTQCYMNAGFEFISKYPDSHVIAKVQIFIALIVMMICGLKFYSLGVINKQCMVLFNLSMVPLFMNIHSLTKNPIKLMISSYPPFIILLAGLFYNLIFNSQTSEKRN